MGAETTTRFRLIDAVVLVGATAAGLALGRGVATWGGGSVTDSATDYAVSLALTWTMAVLILNLTRYRAPRRELVCRPGFSAAMAVAVERAVEFLYVAFVTPLNSPMCLEPISFSGLPAYLSQTMSLCVTNTVLVSSPAGAVAAVWLFAALAGCWRPEKTWIDRTGRVLGAFWLLFVAAYWLSVWASPDPTAASPLGPVPPAGAPDAAFDLNP